MSLQLVIFILYFALVFLIGWVSLKKTQSESDYWIAGGKMGWLVGGATLSATHTSAGTFIGTIGVIYTAGWSFGWLVFAVVLAYWFTAAFLAPRFVRVKELTLPAFLQRRYYGKTPRGIGAGIILIATMVYIQAQIIAGGLVAQVIFGISPDTGMVIFTFILIGYTMIGGMIAVAYTDFLQLVIMVTGALVSVPVAVSHFDGFFDLLHAAQAMNPVTFSWEGFSGPLLFTMGLAFFLGGIATPEKLTRLYAMRDMHTIRRAILLTILLVTGLNLCVFLLGLAGISMFPLLPKGDLAMPMIAKALLPSFTGTIMLAAITSAMMSTVDSLLLVAGSALSEDLYQTFIHPAASRKARMRVARTGILIVGSLPLGSIWLGWGQGELIQFIVLLFTALMASGFFMPVMGGIWWKRATKEGAIAAMLGGASTTFLWKIFGPGTVDPVLPGFLISALLLVVVSLLSPPPPEHAIAPYFSKNRKT